MRLLIPFVLAVMLPLFAVPVVNLNIKETAGVARVDENVTMGVPLPESGAYTDATRFTLRDASNNVIPCEIATVSTWFKNPTHIRWLQLNFPYSIAASTTQVVHLETESSPVVPASKLTAADKGAYFEVNTGKIRFYVKKANFNLIDQAWVDESGAENYTDANKIVAAHNRGLVFYAGAVEHLSSNDAATTVTLARQGAGVICLKAAGVLKSSGGAAPLHFITRIYAFNNSASVRMQTTVENWDQTVTNFLVFKGWHAEIPLNLGASKTATVSKPGGFESSALSAGQELYCMTKRPDTSTTSMGQTIEGVIGGTVTGTFNPKLTRARDIGWAALSDGARGCLVAMKYFWQMTPTSVEALGNGTLVAGMYANRAPEQAVHFYAGAARTFEMQWTFYNSMTNSDLRSRAMGATDRLFALASAYWYTRGTLSAVKMVEKNTTLYNTTNGGYVAGWEAKLTPIWSQVLGADASMFGYDSYGFLEWGDNPHYDASAGDGAWIFTYPWKILWNGNYYGLDFFAFEHFYHTGDARFLEYGIAHARHVQDVHLVHMGPSGGATGGSRYCPPAYHFSTDDDPTKTAGTFTTDNPSHHKTEALWMDYYLTGNDYALQVALEGAEYLNRSGTAYAQPSEHTTTYIRRWSHQMYALTWAYEYNRDARFYSTLAQNWDQMKKDIRDSITLGQPFMVGFGLEAITKMHNILAPAYTNGAGATIPDSIPFYLKKWVDRMALLPPGTGSMQINANVTLGCAFLAPYYGSFYQKLAAAKANALPSSPGNLHKDFAQQARNLEMAMYYMAIPDSVGVSWVALEKAPTQDIDHQLDLVVAPTPTNPSAVISLSGEMLTQGKAVGLRVFSADGALVEDLSDKVDPQQHRVVWKAANGASGVYFVRCDVGSRSVTKRLVIMK